MDASVLAPYACIVCLATLDERLHALGRPAEVLDVEGSDAVVSCRRFKARSKNKGPENSGPSGLRGGEPEPGNRVRDPLRILGAEAAGRAEGFLDMAEASTRETGDVANRAGQRAASGSPSRPLTNQPPHAYINGDPVRRTEPTGVIAPRVQQLRTSGGQPGVM